MSLADTFCEALASVLPHDKFVPLHEPEFVGAESDFVQDCLQSTFVSSVGKYVDRFELMLAEYTGAKYAVAVVNGTTALQVALRLAGVKPGDEVLIPALSFVATANAVQHSGAFPNFVDSNLDTLGIDPAALADYLDFSTEQTTQALINKKTGRRIAAIVPMHTYGHPVAMDRLMEVAARYKLPIVEDSAESLGSKYKGQHTGTFGLLGILSFNGNKVITTGGGGAILTNDAELARQAKHLTTTAKLPHPWEFFHDEVAWNYRMPNLNAALGCAQMESLESFITKKRRLAAKYKKAFQDLIGLQFVEEQKDCTSNYWLQTICLSNANKASRDAILDKANNLGYQCRPTWNLLHKLPMYQDCPRAELKVAEILEKSLINIPSNSKLAGME